MTRQLRDQLVGAATVLTLMIGAYTVGSWGWLWFGWVLAIVLGVVLVWATSPIDRDRDFAARHPAGRALDEEGEDR